MAENINKVFPGGAWFADDPLQRFDHVKQVLDRYAAKEYDLLDVKWFLKNAMVNRIYVSEAVKKEWDSTWVNIKNNRKKIIWNKICTDKSLDDKYMDLRKFTNGFHFEHIVPGNIFLTKLIELYQSNQLDINRFKQFKSKLNICIVTQAENLLLNKYKQSMPGNIDFEAGNVALPAGLIGSGFMDAIAEEKRQKELADYELRLRKSFAHKQCRYTKYRTEPPFVSVVDIQAKQGIDTKDILDAVEASDSFRLRNLASTQPLGEYALDKLVVEHFERNTVYGCKIDRESKVTIVSTSSVQEAGIGNFAYHLAQFGGFNYVSKEVEVNPDEPFSYYNIKSEEGDPNVGTFLHDIKALARGEKHWVIFLLSASGAEEPSYKEQVHWIHGAKRGDSGYADANITVKDVETYDAMVREASAMLHDNYALESDQQKYHAGSSKMYVGRHVQVEGKEINAFTLRMAFGVTVWNDHRIAIANDIAAILRQQLTGATPLGLNNS